MIFQAAKFFSLAPGLVLWPAFAHRRRVAILILLLLAARIATAGDAPSAEGVLTAAEVAVVANSAFPGSVDLALYYMGRRGIPESQLLITAMPDGETVERRVYEHQIAGPLRDFLTEENLGHVRCVVLMHGVPLRVKEPSQTPEDKIMERMVLRDCEDWLAELIEAGRQARRLVLDPAAPKPDAPAFDANAPIDKQADQLAKAFMDDMRQAALRIAALPGGPGRTQAEEIWRALWIRQFGFASPADQGLKTLAVSQTPGERKAGYARRVIDLLRLPLSVEHVREFLDLALESRGTAGALPLAEKMRRRTHPDWQSRASVDSELCTLFWPDPPLDRWVYNPLNNEATATPGAPRTLMVCRLDGPGEAVVRRMIDDAIATEAQGLQGRVYLDSRGFDSAHNAYGRYDVDLQALGRSLEGHSNLGVTLETTGELFQPGDCPDAALYCGWYSLGQYIDAFEFNPGAIAWHIASSEAVSLRKSGSTLWCPSLLADGAAATLGPVEEPFLTAFPLPSRFFGLVLEGRLTLVECYFQTLPSLSWMMTLSGDPLYRPYAANPVKRAEFSAADGIRATLP